jgi:hypothetical protein
MSDHMTVAEVKEQAWVRRIEGYVEDLTNLRAPIRVIARWWDMSVTLAAAEDFLDPQGEVWQDFLRRRKAHLQQQWYGRPAPQGCFLAKRYVNRVYFQDTDTMRSAHTMQSRVVRIRFDNARCPAQGYRVHLFGSECVYGTEHLHFEMHLPRGVGQLVRSLLPEYYVELEISYVMVPERWAVDSKDPYE